MRCGIPRKGWQAGGFFRISSHYRQNVMGQSEADSRLQRCTLSQSFGILELLIKRHDRRDTFDQSPSIVIATKSCIRAIPKIAAVNRRANFVQRNPFPNEFNIGEVPLLCHSGDGHHLSSCRRNDERLFFSAARSDESLKRVDAGRCQGHIPARRGRKRRRASHFAAGNPTSMLHSHIWLRGVLVICDHTNIELKLLRRAKSVGGSDQVGGKTAREKIARRARRKYAGNHDHKDEFSLH